MADDYDNDDYVDAGDDISDDDLTFDDEIDAEVDEMGLAEGEEGDAEAEEDIIKDDEYVSDIDDEGDLTEFQKMLINKQEQKFRTVRHYTKYEPVALIGYRAQQIAEGAPPLTEIGNLTDPGAIAAKEFAEGKIPYNLERILPSNKIGKYSYETRSPDELINVHHMV